MTTPRPVSRLQAEVERLTEAVRAEDVRQAATVEHTGPLELPSYEATAWAQQLLAAARELGPVPDYGTPAWEALDVADPRRVAAAVVSAELVRYEEVTRADRLRLELRAARAEWLAEEEAGWAEAADQLPASVGTPRPALFADPVPVRQTPDWPVVRQPGGQPRAVVPPVSEMIRRVS